MRLAPEQLKRIFSSLARNKCSDYAPLLNAAMEEFGIITRRRASAFLAQVGHESADLKYLEEIASGAAYEGRRDLGNTQAGDGRRFKGRGPIQITGRDNYIKAGDALELDLLGRPELLSDPKHGFRASAWWWKTHGLNYVADGLMLTGDAGDLKRFDKITKTINGGYNGRLDRQRRYLDCIGALKDEDFAAPSPLPGDEPIGVDADTKVPSGGTIENKVGTKTPANETNILDKLAGSGVHRTIAQKFGTRLGTAGSTVLAALEAGNRRVWLGVAVAVIGLAVFIFFERRTIARFLQNQIAKL